MFPGGDDINCEAPSWRLGEGSRLVVGVRLLFLDGRVLDSTGTLKDLFLTDGREFFWKIFPGGLLQGGDFSHVRALTELS